MTVTVELPEVKDVGVVEVCCTIVVVPLAEVSYTWLTGVEELGNCDDAEEPPLVEPVALVAETIGVTDSCEELTGAIEVVLVLPAELATSRWVETVAELDIELEAAGATTDVLIAEALDVTDELVPIAEEVVMLADVPFTSAVAIDIVADGGGGGGGSVAVDVLVVVDEKSDAGGGGIDVNVLAVVDEASVTDGGVDVLDTLVDVLDEASGTGDGVDVLNTLVDVLDDAVVGGGGGSCEVEELVFAVVDEDDDDDVDNTDEVGGGGGVETLTVVVIVDEDSGRGGSCDVLNSVDEKLEAEDVEVLLEIAVLVDEVLGKDDEEGGGGGGGNRLLDRIGVGLTLVEAVSVIVITTGVLLVEVELRLDTPIEDVLSWLELDSKRDERLEEESNSEESEERVDVMVEFIH